MRKQGRKTKKAAEEARPIEGWDFRTVLVGLALALSGWVGLTAYRANQELRDAKEQTVLIRNTNLLLMQQLEHLATISLYPLVPSLDQAAPSPIDPTLLELWLEFDEQFIALNKDRSDLRFEVASVARRTGVVSAMLNKLSDSELYLQESERQFSLLRSEFPENFSYAIEYSGTKLAMAELERSRGNRQAAILHVREALVLLQLKAMPINEEHDRVVKDVLARIVPTLLALDERNLAIEVARANTQTAARLARLHPHEFDDSIKEAEQLLKRCQQES
ncbi:MAG: hypothetical protein KDB22_03040 [Planctomycetales bacterium]|nr:hypothetical protein [Planctomycetales bacterium]